MAFIFGLIYGSFLNVVILRWDDWMSIIAGRSACPNCKQNLRWFDMLPVISFLTLAGRCRYCQKPISWQYPAVELGTAVLAMVGYQQIFSAGLPDATQAVIAFLAYLLVVGLLISVFFHDLYEMLVPDLMGYLLLAAAIIFGVITYGWLNTLYGLLVGVVPIALLVYPSGGRWMGEGDVKIAAGLGAFVGWPVVAVFLLLSFFLGGLYGVLGLTLGKVKMRTAVPFAPFLIVGALLAFFWGKDIISWYFGMAGYGF